VSQCLRCRARQPGPARSLCHATVARVSSQLDAWDGLSSHLCAVAVRTPSVSKYLYLKKSCFSHIYVLRGQSSTAVQASRAAHACGTYSIPDAAPNGLALLRSFTPLVADVQSKLGQRRADSCPRCFCKPTGRQVEVKTRGNHTEKKIYAAMSYFN
jgi:hypothetical protein